MTTTRLLQVVQDGEITVVIIGSELSSLDETALKDVRNELVAIAESAVPPWMILDLTATDYFGSSFVEVLI